MYYFTGALPNYYEALDDIRKVVIASLDTPQEIKYKDLIEQVVDSKKGIPFKRFKGDNLMANLQSIAQRKLAKKLNCTVESLNDGSCQPLINSTDPSLTPEEKARKPFKEMTEPWTRDWIRILPEYEQLEKKILDVLRLPISFLEDIKKERICRLEKQQMQDKLNKLLQTFQDVIAQADPEKKFPLRFYYDSHREQVTIDTRHNRMLLYKSVDGDTLEICDFTDYENKKVCPFYYDEEKIAIMVAIAFTKILGGTTLTIDYTEDLKPRIPLLKEFGFKPVYRDFFHRNIQKMVLNLR